jgi:hypothetical protein
VLFILCQGTYFILFSSFHCVLTVYHIITIFTIAYLFRICYVCLLNTTVPLPSLYFLVRKVWYILNSCLSRRALSCLHGTVPRFQHNCIAVWPMADYKLKVSLGLFIVLDASLRFRAQINPPQCSVYSPESTGDVLVVLLFGFDVVYALGRSRKIRRDCN